MGVKAIKDMKPLDEARILLHTAKLLDASDVMVAVFDPDDRLRYANKAFREAWFIGEKEEPLWAELMRRNYLARRGTVLATSDFDAWLLSTLSRRGKTGRRAFETDLHDGRWLWMTETTEASGWMLCVASDITSIRSDERSLRQDRDQALKAALTDELTGVASRRFVMTKLQELLFQNNDNGKTVGCLCVLDIDNFKYINDRFGHVVGDAILKDFAVTIHRMIRKTDVLGRVGGEEFLLLLPGAAPADAEALLEKMLVAIRHSSPLSDQVSFRYTFSAGIACGNAGEDPADAYRRADLALYAAKMRGRDQIAIDPTIRSMTGSP